MARQDANYAVHLWYLGLDVLLIVCAEEFFSTYYYLVLRRALFRALEETGNKKGVISWSHLVKNFHL
jgi:ferritin-like protein